jgi:hypothetical protein
MLSILVVPPENDIDFPRSVVALLAALGVDTWVFGGWAEEIHGLSRPRSHSDIDLLYVAAKFDRIDALCNDGALTEIAAKRFPHKRALDIDGVMVELFLVQCDEAGMHTEFWGTVRHDWPNDTLGAHRGIPVASKSALAGFRLNHERVHKPRAAWLAK